MDSVCGGATVVANVGWRSGPVRVEDAVVAVTVDATVGATVDGTVGADVVAGVGAAVVGRGGGLSVVVWVGCNIGVVRERVGLVGLFDADIVGDGSGTVSVAVTGKVTGLDVGPTGNVDAVLTYVGCHCGSVVVPIASDPV